MIKDSLILRKRIKAKKPHFVMQDAHKLKCIKIRWRRPRGVDSKMRLYLKGYRKSVEPGYKSPREVKGLDSTGLAPILAYSERDIEKADKNKNSIILGGKVGARKKLLLLDAIKKKGLRVINIKDTEKYLSEIKEEMKKRKETKEKKKKEIKESKEKAEKKDEKKISEDEKSKLEKAEKDKILTKKE